MTKRFLPEELAGRFEGLTGFRPVRSDLWAGLFLLVSFLLFFGPALGGKVYFFRDIGAEIVPKRTWLVNSGFQVLWNPYMFFGLPEGANPQTSAFYPLNFFFYLAPVPRSLSFYVAAHFGLALAFIYLLVRGRGGSVEAAAAGALSFTYGGFFVSLANQIVVLNSAAWLPALLWAVMRAFVSGRRGFVIAGGIFWGLMVLGGEAEIAYLAGLILVFFFGVLMLASRGNEPWSRMLPRAGMIMVATGLIAVGLSAVQWVLTLELASRSNRAGGLSFEDALKWSVEPRALWSLFSPDYIGDPNGWRFWVLGFRPSRLPYLLSIYPGLTVWVLTAAGAVVALISRRRARERFPWEAVLLAGSAAFFLLLSLGRAGGLYWLAFHFLPGFNRFRIPERCLVGFAVFFCLLLSWAVEAIKKQIQNSGGNPARTTDEKKPWPAAASAAVLAATAVFLALKLQHLPPEPSDTSAWRAYHFDLLTLAFLRAVLWVNLLFLAAAVCRWRGSFARFLPGVLLLIFLDLFSAHRHVAPLTTPDFYDLQGHLASGLPRQARGLRVLVAQPASEADRMLGAGKDFTAFYKKQRLGLQAFTGLELGITEVESRSSFYPADVDLWHSLLPSLQLKLLAFGGVRYALRLGSHPLPVPDPLPRAFVVPNAHWFPNRTEVLKELSRPDFDPRQEVLLEGPTPETEPPRLLRRLSPMRILRAENQRVEIELEGQHPGYLVLLDTFYPGWKAELKGQPLPIYRANGFFRAVPVGPEPGVVIFTYWPARFFVGLGLTLLTLLISLALLLRGGQEKAQTSSSTPEAGPARRRPTLEIIIWLALTVIIVFLPMAAGGTTYLAVNLLEILVLLLAAAFSWQISPSAGRVFRSRLDLWLFAFWLLAALALLRSQYFYISFYWTLNLFVLLVLFYCLLQFTAEPEAGQRRSRRLLALLVFAGTVESAWAIGETMRLLGGREGPSTGDFRAAAGYLNPAFLASSLMATSPYILCRMAEVARENSERWKVRMAGWGALFLLFTLGILFSRSRAVIVWPVGLLLAGLPAVAAVLESRGMTPAAAARRSRLIAFVALLAALLLLLLVPNPLRDRVRQLHRDPYAFERVNIWGCALKVIRDHPLGVGPGMFKYYSNRYRFPVEGVMAGRYEKHPESAHQEYLQLAAEFSPAAPLFLAGALVLTARAVRRTGRRGGWQPEKTGAWAGITVLALHGLFDVNLHNQALAVILVTLGAVLLAELSRSDEKMIIEEHIAAPGVWLLRAVAGGLFLAGVPFFGFLAWSFRFTLLAEAEKDPGRAVMLLAPTARWSFGNARHFKTLAVNYYSLYRQSEKLEHLKEALTAVEKALSFNPVDPELYRLRGQYLLSLYAAGAQERKVLTEAEGALARGLELSPFDIDLVIGRAWAARLGRDVPAEQRWWRRALELEPYDLMVRVRLVRALLEAGETEEARAQWEEFRRRRHEVEERARKNPRAFASLYRSKRTALDEEEIQGVLLLLRQSAGPPPAAPGEGEEKPADPREEQKNSP